MASLPSKTSQNQEDNTALGDGERGTIDGILCVEKQEKLERVKQPPIKRTTRFEAYSNKIFVGLSF